MLLRRSFLIDGPIQSPNLLDERLELGRIPDGVQIRVILHMA